MKMVFVARMIRHRICMIHAFFDFFCSKIIFDQQLFSYCRDKSDYPGVNRNAKIHSSVTAKSRGDEAKGMSDADSAAKETENYQTHHLCISKKNFL